MSKYPNVVIDSTKNTPVSMVGKLSNEQVYDLFHHTHKMSDLIKDIEQGVEKYDDTELRNLIDSKVNNLYNKVMGITNEDSTTVNEAYDTLKEVAAYINGDGAIVTEILNKLAAVETALTNKVDTVKNKSLVADKEIKRLANVDNYDDTEVKALIEALTAKVASLEPKEKFVISNVPEGTLIMRRSDEIRIMCPANTVWTKQNVGPTGNSNMYYMAFKAYAPEGAVSFKEGDRGVIVDKMFTFDDEFAGTDENGNYSVCWLALASYDEGTDTWTYFGKNSAIDNKFIGWDYVVEWYDANGVIINADCIRISLSNESCHLYNKPFFTLPKA